MLKVVLWMVGGFTFLCSLLLNTIFLMKELVIPFPIPDLYSAGMVFPTEEDAEVVVGALTDIGLAPNGINIDTKETMRATWNGGKTLLMASADRNGTPQNRRDTVCTFQWVVDDPQVWARKFKQRLLARKRNGEILDDPHADINPGALSAVTTDAWPHGAIAFRKRGDLMMKEAEQ